MAAITPADIVGFESDSLLLYVLDLLFFLGVAALIQKKRGRI
jgi:hypothetical protein